MSPKRKNKYLPRRVTKKHGAYYYLKPIIKNGKPATQWVRLGKTESEMHRSLADMKSQGEGSMAAVIRRYREEVLSTKAENTQASQGKQLDRIEKAFGLMRPQDIRPMHIAQYHQLVGKKAPYMANRELSLIKRVMGKARSWGYIDENPAKDIERFPEMARDRYITHEEYVTVRNAAPVWIGILMDLSYLTGQRRVDLLGMTRKQIDDKGIRIVQSKTGTALDIEWTDDLRATIQWALNALHTGVDSMYIVCDERGQKRRDAAFTTAWTRLMNKCIKNNLITQKFQFRDIRAKAGTDSSGEQLGHKSDAILNKHYKRLPRQVKPTQ